MISTYNEQIINKIIPQIKTLYADIAEELQVKTKVLQPISRDLNYYINSKSTCAFTVIFTVTNKYSKSVDSFELEIPKMINNIFVIKGKYRVDKLHLVTDPEIRITDSAVNIDIDRKYLADEGEFHYRDDYSEPFSIIKMSEFDSLDSSYKTITDLQRRKIEVKLDREIPTSYITAEILEDLFELGSDYRRDFILDKKIQTIDASLSLHIKGRSRDFRFAARSKAKNSRERVGGPKLYSTDMDKIIVDFFNMKSAGNISIEAPSSVNPLSFDSVRGKITISQSVAYNRSFSDLIDCADTPENNNVNKINHLTQCASVVDGVMSIEVFDANFKPVIIPYVTYLSSKVLKSAHVDYKNKLISKINGAYDYKLRNKGYFTSDYNDIDYIDASDDSKLSVSTRRIPFLNYSDSVRIAMGASMLNQAVDIAEAESPLVTTGNDEEDLKLSSLIVRFKEDKGTVTSIEGDLVTVTLEDQTEVVYQIPDPITSINEVSINFTCNLRVGDSISNMDPIVTPQSLKKGSFNMGLNTMIAFMPYRGFNHEDGLVISKSYSKRMGHYSILDLNIIIKDTDIIDSMIPIGTEVKYLDQLVECYRSKNMNPELDRISEVLPQMIRDKKSNKSLRVPNGVEYAIVSDVKFTRGRSEIRPDSLEVIENFSLDRSEASLKIPSRLFHRGVPVPEDIELDEVAGVISIRLIQTNYVKLGDKIANRYGSKGVVSLIEEDEDMPRMKDGRIVDAVLNPYSIISRKNISQVLEMYCGNIAEYFYNKFNSLIESGTLDLSLEVRSELREYYGDKFDNMTIDAFIHAHSMSKVAAYQFSTGAFSKMNPEQILEWITKLDIPSKQTLIDGRTGRKIKNDVVVGSQYLIKLYHIPEFKGKSTSVTMGSHPILGKGKYRNLGQNIGEQESWALISHGQSAFLSHIREESSYESNYSLINSLLQVGIKLTYKGNP